ncbi:MAG: glycosyltransferase family 2 protein [Armatimonadetes bacterium]|nr:glycosyltransferase family 2 protein [Armatimonadota bacterium]
MRCSMLIVNWRSSALLRKLLESIQQHPPSGEYEVIVVDNDAGHFEAASFQQDFPAVRFFAQSENLGFARGNNVAFSHSRGDYIVLLNPDTQVTPGALDTLLDFLMNHPCAAIAAPQLILPGGAVQSSCREFPWPLSLLWAALKLPRLFPKSRIFGAYRMTYFDHLHTRQVDQPMASCWAVPRAAWEIIGGFDEAFPILFNDVDWAWRAREAGWEVWFVAEAKVAHVGGHSTQSAGAWILRESHLGLVKFYNKDLKGRSSLLWLGKAISWVNWKMRTARAQRG